MADFRPFLRLLGCSLLSASCASSGAPATPADPVLGGMKPARLHADSHLDAMDKAIATYFEGHATRRTYILTDKPLYQPGETIWFRVDMRQAKSLVAADAWAAAAGM